MPDSDLDEDRAGENAESSQRIRVLEKKLAMTRKELTDYRALVSQRLTSSGLLETADDPSTSVAISSTAGNDDSYYFQSYDDNGVYQSLFLLFAVDTSSSLDRYPCFDDPGPSTHVKLRLIHLEEPGYIS